MDIVENKKSHPILDGMSVCSVSSDEFCGARYDLTVGAWVVRDSLAVLHPEFSGPPTKKKDSENGEDEK